MLRATLVFVLLAVVAFAEPGEDRIRALVAQLDSDDPAERDEATAELEKTGPTALPALRKAVAVGSSEAKGRAAALVRTLGVREILERPENEWLRWFWKRARGEQIGERERAFSDFVFVGRATLAHGDALAEILALKPDNDDAVAARECLSWLMSPRTINYLYTTGHVALESANAGEYLRQFLGGRFRCDEATGALVAKIETPHIGLNEDPSTLLESVQWICDQAGLAWYADDAANTLRISTPEDCEAARLAEWKRLRDDALGIADLGLAPRPDGAKLRLEEIDRWLGELESADGHHARVARAVLRDAPDEVRAEIALRAGLADASKVLKTLAAVQALRSRSRVAFIVHSGDAWSLWTARPDGSSAKRLERKLEPGHVIAGSTEKCVVVQSWRKDILCLDPDRAAEFRSIKCWSFDTLVISPDGRRAALQKEEGMDIVDLDTGKRSSSGADSGSHGAAWSRDGRMLAWVTRETFEIFDRDLSTDVTRRLTEGAAYVGDLQFGAGGVLAWMEKAKPSSATRRVCSLDTTTGKVSHLRESAREVGAPAWSPDGTRIAWPWRDAENEKGSTYVDILTPPDGDHDRLEFGGRIPWSRHLRCSWSPDGAFIAVAVPGEEILVIRVQDHDCDDLPPLDGDALTVPWVADSHAFFDLRAGDLILRFPDGASWPIFESAGGVFSPVSLEPAR